MPAKSISAKSISAKSRSAKATSAKSPGRRSLSQKISGPKITAHKITAHKVASRKTASRRATSREAIIAAAARLFAKTGYSECEMGRLAEKLGVAKGTLYLYFESKEALFCACVDDGMHRAQQTTLAAAEAETDLLQKLAAAIRAYLAFFDRHPHYIELLLQERAIFRSRRPPSYFKNRDVNRSRWREVYLALMQQGRIRGDLPVERILDVVGSLLYGAIFTNYFVGRSVSTQEQFEAIWNILLEGLQSR